MRRYGETGARLARLARGEDAPGGQYRRRDEDGLVRDDLQHRPLRRFEELSTELLALSERLSERLKAKNLVGDTVTLKLKSAGFRLRTRARHLMIPTQLASVLYETGRQLLAREIDGTAFRLIGIGVSGLSEAERRRSRRPDRTGDCAQGRGRTCDGPRTRPFRQATRSSAASYMGGASPRGDQDRRRTSKKARTNDHPDREAARVWLRTAAPQAAGRELRPVHALGQHPLRLRPDFVDAEGVGDRACSATR